MVLEIEKVGIIVYIPIGLHDRIGSFFPETFKLDVEDHTKNYYTWNSKTKMSHQFEYGAYICGFYSCR